MASDELSFYALTFAVGSGVSPWVPADRILAVALRRRYCRSKRPPDGVV
jgi:hypothetical protein